MTKRICELSKGETFFFDGIWRKVCRIENGRLYYKNVSEYGKGNYYDSLGAKSQQLVQVEESVFSSVPKYDNRRSLPKSSLTIKQRNANAA